jgi:hypothetical protein
VTTELTGDGDDDRNYIAFGIYIPGEGIGKRAG